MLYRRPVPVRRSHHEIDAAHIELIHLKLAHAQLLRYAQDLKLAYEAERARRTELARVALDLVTVLSVVPTAESAIKIHGLAPDLAA